MSSIMGKKRKKQRKKKTGEKQNSRHCKPISDVTKL